MPSQWIQAPVADVTLFEDRAQVTRRGQATLTRGLNELVVAGFAPVAVDKTVHITLSSGAVRSLTIRRRDEPKHQASHETIRDLRQRAEVLTARATELTNAIQQLAQVRDDQRQIQEQTLVDLTVDVANGSADADGWQATIDACQDAAAETRAREAELARDLRQVKSEGRALRQELKLAEASYSQRVAELVVVVDSDQDGDVNLSIEYLVPSACWRPAYRARLDRGVQAQLALEVEACIWQRTGEDWQGVALRCSTRRASAGISVPTLTDDLLRVVSKRPEVAVEAREQAIATTGVGAASGAVMDQVPGVDDGGEVRVWSCADPVDVTSDGRPHRCPVTTMTSPASVSVRAWTDITTAALVACQAENRSDLHLLAGPVELIVDGGRVGRSELASVAVGERFDLGFGPEASLRISRRCQRGETTSKALSSWSQRTTTTEVKLSNISADPVTCEVIERVPVSEVTKVEVVVEASKTTASAEPDADGHIRWQITIPAHGTQQIDLVWHLRTQGNVVGV